MKLLKTLITTIMFIFSLESFAVIPEDLKDLNLTKPDYEFLNPVTGFVWLEGGVLENYGELSQDSDLKTLITNLFHRVDRFFIPSTSETGVANYLTPNLIGKILGYVAANRETDIGKDDFKKTLKVIFHVNLEGIKKRDGRILDPRKLNNSINKVATIFYNNRKDPNLYTVFLALLWDKATNREDILKYYQGLQSQIGNIYLQTPENLGNPEWLQAQFKKEDFDDSPPPIEEYEKRLYWTYINANDTIPLEHTHLSFVEEGNFSDCGATSLRNFFKIFLDYNGEKPEGVEGDYNLSVLNELQAIAEVKEFFNMYNTRRSQQTQGARNAWGKLTCNKENIYYLQLYKCEIGAGANNMFNLINQLLFKETEKAQDWPDLASKIQAARSGRDFSFTEVILEEDDYGTLNISASDFSLFKWSFLKTHFEIKDEPKGSMSEPSELKSIMDASPVIHFNHLGDEPKTAEQRIKNANDKLLIDKKRALNIYSLYPTTEGKIDSLMYRGEHYYTKLERVDDNIKFYQKSKERERLKAVAAVAAVAAPAVAAPAVAVPVGGPAAVPIDYDSSSSDDEDDSSSDDEEEAEEEKKEEAGDKHLNGNSAKTIQKVVRGRLARKITAKKRETAIKITAEKRETAISEATSRLNLYLALRDKRLKGDIEALDRLFKLTSSTDLFNFYSSEKNVPNLYELQLACFNGEIELAKKIFKHKKFPHNDFTNPKTGKLLIGHTKKYGNPVKIEDASFNVDGSYIVTRSSSTAIVWNTQTGELLHTLLDDVSSASFEQNGNKIITTPSREGNKIKVWSSDDRWETAISEEIDIKISNFSYTSASFSPDGTKIIIVGRNYGSDIAHWSTIVFDIVKKVLIVTKNYISAINSASFSPSGKNIVIALDNGEAEIWGIGTKDNKLKSRYKTFSKFFHIRTLKGHTSSVYSASYSYDGLKIITSSYDKTAKIWNANTGALLHTLSGHAGSPYSASFSPDDTKVVTGSWDQTAKIWDVRTGKILKNLSGHIQAVLSAAFSPDGTKVVTTSGDGTAKIWDLNALEIGFTD